MATTFKSSGSGRIPGLRGGKVPGPGMKIKTGTFTLANDNPTEGFTAAAIATLVGFTTVLGVVPMGGGLKSGMLYQPVWDSIAQTLRIFGNLGTAVSIGTSGVGAQMLANSANSSGATFDALIIGY
jgi:hypothetical protein